MSHLSALLALPRHTPSHVWSPASFKRKNGLSGTTKIMVHLDLVERSKRAHSDEHSWVVRLEALRIAGGTYALIAHSPKNCCQSRRRSHPGCFMQSNHHAQLHWRLYLEPTSTRSNCG